MNHSSNESLSKLELKNDFISDFAKNKLVEVVRVTNALYLVTSPKAAKFIIEPKCH